MIKHIMEEIVAFTVEAKIVFLQFTDYKAWDETRFIIIHFNVDMERSWFHGIPDELLSEVSASLDIPIKLIKTSGEDYAANFEKELKVQKENGAEICVFGDIDLEEHLQWCTARCDAV